MRRERYIPKPHPLVQEALKSGFWIRVGNERPYRWYTPEEYQEFYDVAASRVFDYGAYKEDTVIADPIAALRESHETIAKLQQKHQEFEIRILKYFQEKKKK